MRRGNDSEILRQPPETHARGVDAPILSPVHSMSFPLVTQDCMLLLLAAETLFTSNVRNAKMAGVLLGAYESRPYYYHQLRCS